MGSHYLVSARKYRPKTFDSVVGQSHITTTLKNALRRGQLAHAYLFCGPRGVGKTSCARILAKTVNCLSPTEDMEACGQCAHCLHFSTSSSFNIFELDAASHNSVEDIRNLTDQVQFAPQQGKYKVYIIDEVHMLSTAAFNAFLKTLEEPPEYAIFILATTEKHRILPTILSRCQVFDFKRISTEDMVNHLQEVASLEGALVEEAGLHVIAQKSEGCMRDALSMLDRILSFTGGSLTYQQTMEHLNLLDADFYFRLSDALLAKDLTQVLLEVNQVMDRGFEAEVILDGLGGHFRNLLMAREAGMARLLEVPREHKALYFEKAAQMPPSFILSGLSLLHEALLSIRTVPQRKLHVEVTLIRLCYVLEATAEKKKRLGKPPERIHEPAREPGPALKPEPTREEAGQCSREEEIEVRTSVPSAIAPATPSPERISPGVPSPAAGSQPSESPALKTPGPGPRISRRMMDWSKLESEEIPKPVSRQWDQGQLQQIFQQFLAEKIPMHQSIARTQFGQMALCFSPPDEVKLICPGHLVHSLASQYRDQLIDYFRKQTGSPIRVVIETREPEPGAEPEVEVRSRMDCLELFRQKNPLLAEMQQRLGLKLELS